jgi:hypothetical protein
MTNFEVYEYRDSTVFFCENITQLVRSVGQLASGSNVVILVCYSVEAEV